MMLSSMVVALVSRSLLALMWLRTFPSSGRITIDSTGKLGRGGGGGALISICPPTRMLWTRECDRPFYAQHVELKTAT